MSTFSSCPKCAKPITVPRGAEPADMVRCPLCLAEYMLAEALANAPPELLVLRSLAGVSREEPHDAPAGGGTTDLHLFDHASSELLDGPSIDLSDSPHVADEELVPKFDLADDDILASKNAFRDAEPDRADLFDSADRDTELEHSASGSTSDGDFDLDSPTMAFEMAAGADEEAPQIDADQPREEIALGGFGDEPDDVTSLDMPADDDADMALAGTETSEDAKELENAPRRERRKPSVLAGLIIWSTSLPVAAVLAYAILLWGLGKDPAGLAPKLPAFLVPSSLANPPARGTANQIARATPQATADEDPGFNTNVPPLGPRANGGQPGDTSAVPKGGKTVPDDADDPADDMTDDADVKPTPAENPADDGMMDEPADDGADQPRTKPARPRAADPAADDDAAMDDDPSETTEPAADRPNDVADDMPDDAPDSAAPDDPADLATTEPADVPGSDVAAPEEETEPTVAVGPRDNVHYSADDVEKGLTEARDAGTALSEADKDGLKKAKAQYYRKLYQLAELATFAENDAVDPEEDLSKIQELLAEVAGDRARFGEIGKAAGKWIAVAKGKEHQGVVLAGSVQSVTKQGHVYETKILLTDGVQVVSVLSAQKLPVAAKDQVVVLGSIVSDPAKTIEGYEGAEPTAVWSGVAIKAPASG